MKRRRVTLLFAALILIGFARQLQLTAECCGLHWRSILFPPNEVILLDAGAAYTGMDLRTDGWRLFTSMFVHGGVLHLALNLVALVQLGYLLEALWGSTAMAVSFALGGVLGGLGAVLLTKAGGLVYVGASGAIFAVAGTLLVGLRRIWKQQGAIWSQRLSSRLVGCLALNLGLGLMISALATWADLGFVVANTAHVTGLIAGIAIGLAMPFKKV